MQDVLNIYVEVLRSSAIYIVNRILYAMAVQKQRDYWKSSDTDAD